MQTAPSPLMSKQGILLSLYGISSELERDLLVLFVHSGLSSLMASIWTTRTATQRTGLSLPLHCEHCSTRTLQKHTISQQLLNASSPMLRSRCTLYSMRILSGFSSTTILHAISTLKVFNHPLDDGPMLSRTALSRKILGSILVHLPVLPGEVAMSWARSCHRGSVSQGSFS